MLNVITHFIKAYEELHTLVKLYPALNNFYFGANRYLKYNALINTRVYLNKGGEAAALCDAAEKLGLSRTSWNFAFENGFLAQNQDVEKTSMILQDIMQNTEQACILLANLALLISNNEQNPRTLTFLVSQIRTATITDEFSEQDKSLMLELAQAQQLRLMQNDIPSNIAPITDSLTTTI
ncbi:hypothetical protein [Algibacillus agarilyticus]|uniref:hypothetical protein n=1 Tax=Algibacillus agarilyticus TaxID=2234133 RepID=UPI000DD02554|nr:hypothetical protein [Algibacillus agarilyticus]